MIQDRLDRLDIIAEIYKRRKLAGKKILRAIKKPNQIIDYFLLRINTWKRNKVKELTANTVWNRKMRVFFPEPVSISIYFNGFTEPEISLYLLRKLKSGMIFFDIGSHFGYFALLGAYLVSENGKVVAFEPTPNSFSLLEKNSKNYPNIMCVNNAAFDKEITLPFYDLGVLRSAFNSFYTPRIPKHLIKHTERIKVKTIILDKFIKELKLNPDIIKIDVESSELNVLNGLTETLEKISPTIILEVGDLNFQNAGKSRKLVDFMKEKKYNVYSLVNGLPKLHEPLKQYGYTNLLFSKEKLI